MVAPPSPREWAQSSFTIGDLDDVPADGRRYELLDGALLVTAAPGPVHQWLATLLSAQLVHHLAATPEAMVFAVGVVQRGTSTHFEPDLLVGWTPQPPITEWTQLTERWLAVEVYSPGSRTVDRDVKATVYLDMGVRELWLVDPHERTFTVLSRSFDGSTTQRTVRDVLTWTPPHSAGPLAIDVAALFARVVPAGS